MGIILFLNKKRLLTKEQRPERPQWVGNQTETRISIENHFFRANQLYMETWKWLYCKGFSYQGPYETLYISSYGPLFWPLVYSAATAKSCQSCPTLCDPIDGSPPGSPVPGILQARTLEWGAMSFSNAWKWKVKMKSLSHVWLLATPWTAAYQGSSIHGIFQARVLEWGAIAFSVPKHEPFVNKLYP